jgi:hypothetical protein
VGQPHSACENEKRRAIRYVVGMTYDEIIQSRDFDPIYSIDETAGMMMASYSMATDNECSEIELLVGDYKQKNTPSNDVYDAVCEALFGGDWPVMIGSKEFLKAFVATAKKITGKRAGKKMTKTE